MIRPTAFVLVVVALVGLSGCARAHGDRVDPMGSVVEVEANGCRPFAARAVGMAVDDTLVATVAHAVAGEPDVEVSTPDGRTLRAKVAAIDTALDAAVLRVDGLDLRPLDRRSYRDGEAVELVRAAAGEVGSTPVRILRRVTIRTSDIYRAGIHLRPGFELAAVVRPGDSGGGIVGSDGRLLGLVWAASRDSDDRAWALPVEAIGPLLGAARTGRTPPRAACAR
jgi:S1-C subfamily serine protease